MGLFHCQGIDTEALKRELIAGIHAKDVMAEVEARRAAQINAQQHRTFGGGSRAGSFGEVKMRLPVSVALAWKLREGQDVMRDPFWQGYMRKHFPGFFPRCRSERLARTVVATGMPKSAAAGLVDRTGCPLRPAAA